MAQGGDQTAPGPAAPGKAPPGWYRDPVGRYTVRYWDASRWTEFVSDGEAMYVDSPAPSSPGPTVPGSVPHRATRPEARPHRSRPRPRFAYHPRPRQPAHPSTYGQEPRGPRLPPLPFTAVRYALGGWIFALLAASAFAVVADALFGAVPVTVLAFYAGLWIPMFVASSLAARRFGSGGVRSEFGLRISRHDLAPGALIALLGALAQQVVHSVLAPYPALAGTTSGFLEAEAQAAGALLVLATATVGAPVFEELFFRGLVLRSLLDRFRPSIAVAVTAAVFGCVHVVPGVGLGNVGIVLAIASAGAVYGTAAFLLGRLAPVVVAHGVHNALIVIPVLVQLA